MSDSLSEATVDEAAREHRHRWNSVDAVRAGAARFARTVTDVFRRLLRHVSFRPDQRGGHQRGRPGDVRRLARRDAVSPGRHRGRGPCRAALGRRGHPRSQPDDEPGARHRFGDGPVNERGPLPGGAAVHRSARHVGRGPRDRDPLFARRFAVLFLHGLYARGGIDLARLGRHADADADLRDRQRVQRVRRLQLRVRPRSAARDGRERHRHGHGVRPRVRRAIDGGRLCPRLSRFEAFAAAVDAARRDGRPNFADRNSRGRRRGIGVDRHFSVPDARLPRNVGRFGRCVAGRARGRRADRGAHLSAGRRVGLCGGGDGRPGAGRRRPAARPKIGARGRLSMQRAGRSSCRSCITSRRGRFTPSCTAIRKSSKSAFRRSSCWPCFRFRWSSAQFTCTPCAERATRGIRCGSTCSGFLWSGCRWRTFLAWCSKAVCSVRGSACVRTWACGR